MRLLFVSTSAIGHVQPMLGLALAALARGHAVAWATARSAWPLLMPHGIEPLEAGPPFQLSLAEYRRRWSEVHTQPGPEHARHAIPHLFGATVAPAMLPGLVEAVRHWRPDLIVNETLALAAPLVAAIHGLPHVTHAFGLPVPLPLLCAAATEMAVAWNDAGLAPPIDAGLYRHAGIEIAPPSLLAVSANPVLAQRVIRQRPASVDGAPTSSLPASLQEFLGDGGPVVYATFGTLHPGGPPFDALVDALVAADVRAIVTTGPLATTARCAKTLWIGDYVPQHLTLPHCAAVVSHGGSGTMLAALAHGLPQVCLPQGADQFRNADALHERAVAVVLGSPTTPAASPEAIAEAILQALDDATLRERARALQREMDAMPTPDDVLDELSSIA